MSLLSTRERLKRTPQAVVGNSKDTATRWYSSASAGAASASTSAAATLSRLQAPSAPRAKTATWGPGDPALFGQTIFEARRHVETLQDWFQSLQYVFD